MDRQRKAVPTEYKGVRFRSKSEACFAMYLDHYNVLWEYEPKELALECGYVPDFRIIRHSAKAFYCELIEYKPSMATDTYLHVVMEKLLLLSNHVAMECYPAVFMGSFWNNDAASQCEVIRPDLQRGGFHRIDGWQGKGDDEWALRQQIAQHRFDLVSELSEWKGHL